MLLFGINNLVYDDIWNQIDNTTVSILLWVELLHISNSLLIQRHWQLVHRIHYHLKHYFVLFILCGWLFNFVWSFFKNRLDIERDLLKAIKRVILELIYNTVYIFYWNELLARAFEFKQVSYSEATADEHDCSYFVCKWHFEWIFKEFTWHLLLEGVPRWVQIEIVR